MTFRVVAPSLTPDALQFSWLVDVLISEVRVLSFAVSSKAEPRTQLGGFNSEVQLL